MEIEEKYNERFKDLRNGVIPEYLIEENWILNLEEKYFNNYYYYKDILSPQEYRKVINKKSSRSKKRNRCNKKLEEIINLKNKLSNDYKVVFGTITLDNNFLNLNKENQKKVIQRYLKKHYIYVLKNSDFCPTTDRLHYHFVGITNETLQIVDRKSKKGRQMYKLKNDSFKYCLKNGKKDFTPKLEIVKVSEKTLSNYLVKLNNHSNKIENKKTRLSVLKNIDSITINLEKSELF